MNSRDSCSFIFHSQFLLIFSILNTMSANNEENYAILEAAIKCILAKWTVYILTHSCSYFLLSNRWSVLFSSSIALDTQWHRRKGIRRTWFLLFAFWNGRWSFVQYQRTLEFYWRYYYTQIAVLSCFYREVQDLRWWNPRFSQWRIGREFQYNLRR